MKKISRRDMFRMADGGATASLGQRVGRAAFRRCDLCGLVMPLLLTWRPGWLRESNITATAVLVLVGGFLLRYVIVFSSESI